MTQSILENYIKNTDKIFVAIDGRCGSGKTYQTSLFSDMYQCQVIHMDHFYLPMNNRQSNWRDLVAGNIDFDRFREEIILPYKHGTLTSYTPYNCSTKSYGPPIQLPNSNITIVEGSYSLHPSIAMEYDLKLFFTCSNAIQIERLNQRDSSSLQTFISTWIPLEERYFSTLNISNIADHIINTD